MVEVGGGEEEKKFQVGGDQEKVEVGEGEEKKFQIGEGKVEVGGDQEKKFQVEGDRAKIEVRWKYPKTQMVINENEARKYQLFENGSLKNRGNQRRTVQTQEIPKREETLSENSR